MQGGFGAVRHRAVAERARLPLAATTYYFSSLEDLQDKALRKVVGDWLQRARSALDDVPSRLIGTQQATEAILATVVMAPTMADVADADAVLVLYERYLEAAKNPGLRAVMAGYDQELETLVCEVLRRADLRHDQHSARLVLAVLDGAVMRAMAEGSGLAAAVPVVQRLLDAYCL